FQTRWGLMRSNQVISAKPAYIESVASIGLLTGTDHLSFRPALVALVTVSGIALVCSLPGSVSFLLIPISLLGYGLAVIVILALVVYCFVKKRPRRGSSALLTLLLPVLLWRPISWAVNVVHLGLTAGFGVGEIGAPLRSSDGTFVAHDWSVGLVGGPSTFLIHDVTDEITLSMPQHTRPPRAEGGECAGRVQHLVRHYYICSF
ncbi:MAG: hypothetical protein M3Y72_03050, partial [Acidobacteriota bacterium]|nr:hypothetical protein [Acidobacteriota bacterium]